MTSRRRFLGAVLPSGPSGSHSSERAGDVSAMKTSDLWRVTPLGTSASATVTLPKTPTGISGLDEVTEADVDTLDVELGAP